MFCLQVMVGVIILYDHIHPMGAFAKKSAIDVSTIQCNRVTVIIIYGYIALEAIIGNIVFGVSKKTAIVSHMHVHACTCMLHAHGTDKRQLFFKATKGH